MRITILGAGSWGTALSCLLIHNGHEVSLWSWKEKQVEELRQNRENSLLPGIRLPEELRISNDYALAEGAEMVIFAVPSGAIKQVAEAAAPYIPAEAILVNVAKGFFPGTLQRLSQVLAEVFPAHPILTLSGPSHAEEAARELPTAVVIAGNDLALLQKAQAVFMNEFFRVYPNTDQIGVEVGGAVKNIIALGAGVLDGWQQGDNAKAALMTRGLVEIKRLGVAMGAEAETFSGLAGMGDLIVTCTSVHSRNYRAGQEIGKGRSLQEVLDSTQMVVEGVYAAETTYKLAQRHHVEMPITEQIYKLLYENVTPQEAMRTLFNRDRRIRE
ncbi:MAG: NAD(P)-dependent glycerol-3-phosphate dehydrogenase [Firmicutes bacterium]|nr:NAD(P)-dependent glycerol-3-phosphate dehydrogenase [Bacillota bacterium]